MKIYKFSENYQQTDFPFLGNYLIIPKKTLSDKEIKDAKLSEYKDFNQAVYELQDENFTLVDILTYFDIDYEIKNLNNNEFLVFRHNNGFYISDDFNDNSLEYKDFDSWIYSIQDWDLDKYMPIPEESFWDSPAILYHGTTSDNWEEIQESGEIEARSDSRGVSNRGMADAVFTSLNQEGTESYGDVVLEINTLKMKNDSYMPEVSGEEPLIVNEQRASIANVLGYHEFVQDDYSSDGLSSETIAIFGSIPLKYVKRIQ
jgi:hypothetical protein